MKNIFKKITFLMSPATILAIVIVVFPIRYVFAAVDMTYHLLAPLPEIEKTFDPTQVGNLGNYLNPMINLFIGICAILAVIIIVMGGIQYMTSELIPSKEAAKEKIRNALLGLFLALGAWVILYTINPDILNVDLSALKKVEVEIELEALPDGSYSSSGGAGGSCTTITNPENSCSTTKLASQCFGNRAEEASKICSRESGGGLTGVESGSDLLNNGTGPSYSVGLWQINLTVHKVGGLDCPSAFSGKCGAGTATQKSSGPYVGGPKIGNCSVAIKPEKMQLYKDCVAAAKNATENTKVACSLYNQSGFKPWAYSANQCGVSS